jgi:hypothetical protein
LHTRAATGGKTHKCQFLRNTGIDGLYKFLADHRAHGSTDEPEFKRSNDHFYIVDAPLNNHQSIFFAGAFLRGRDAIFIFFKILELENVNWLDICE